MLAMLQTVENMLKMLKEQSHNDFSVNNDAWSTRECNALHEIIGILHALYSQE